MAADLSQVRIVLVEPAGALNLGSVARVMKNMGLSQLVLVSPRCDPQAEAARRMAVHGGDILASAQTVESLIMALSGCQRAVATTGRDWAEAVTIESPEMALPWLVPEPPSQLQTALIFGPEDRGLNNQELNYAQRVVRIPTGSIYPSLNLAQAVAVCCYLLYRSTLPLAATETQPLLAPPVREEPTIPLEQVDQFLQDLESLLLKISYLYPHTASSRMAKFRRLIYKTAPNGQELAMLRGILRQVDWALKSESSEP